MAIFHQGQTIVDRQPFMAGCSRGHGQLIPSYRLRELGLARSWKLTRQPQRILTIKSDLSKEYNLGVIRRRELAYLSMFAAASRLMLPQEAMAAGPGFSMPGFQQQPTPVRFPRRKLDQRFAVLLLRSTYDAVDDLDFIPMDGFQKAFWKQRQAEWEPYTIMYSPVRIRQGDLTDPCYFDFISFSQYATISREIQTGRQVFEEFCQDCEGQRQLVTRNPLLQDNAALPAALQERIGDAVYRGLRTGFQDEMFNAPAPAQAGTSIQELAEGVRGLLTVFADRGFMIRGDVTDVTPSRSDGSVEYHGAGCSGGSFRVRLEGPAHLWGLTQLTARGSLLRNPLDALAIQGFLRASGCASPTFRLELGEASVTEYWTVC